MYSWERKSIRKFNVEAKSCTQKDKKFKDSLNEKLNKGNSALRAGMHLAKLPTCKEERPKESSAPKCRKVCSTKE